MKTYGDLDLKSIREAADLDFAHYTYQPDMCSCCYGPTDLPTRYWRNEETKNQAIQTGECHYFLFKNAHNGSGSVKKNDTIEPSVFIEWAMTSAQMDRVIPLLQAQLGDGYEVIRPENENRCIEIRANHSEPSDV